LTDYIERLNTAVENVLKAKADLQVKFQDATDAQIDIITTRFQLIVAKSEAKAL
jgi:hypothetical protein